MDRKISQIPTPTGKMKALDLEYETVKEDWNIYKLEDGTILKAKIVAGKISRGLADDGKSIFYNPDGEPFYNIRFSVSIVPEVPEKLLEK
ncbi:hypothetical protein ACFLUX_01055 [Chloroflexota bacterium]